MGGPVTKLLKGREVGLKVASLVIVVEEVVVVVAVLVVVV